MKFELPDMSALQFVVCPACSELVMPGPCPVCYQRAEAAAAAIRRRRGCGFPAHFDWIEPINQPDAKLTPPDRRPITMPAAGTPWGLYQHVDASRRAVVTLCGPAGSGKTSLAVAIARTRPSAVYASATELERDVAASQLGHEAPSVARARNCRVLVLDDLGKESGTRLNPIPAIIQHRHDHELYTLVTTGLTPEQVLARYDEGIHRRLFEGTAALVLRWK